MGVPLAELARLVQGRLRGNPGFVVERANSLDRAGPQDITFVVGARNRRRLSETRAGAVILVESDAEQFSGNALVVENPQLAFAHICGVLHPATTSAPGVHPTAVVDSSARVASSAIVAAGVVIGPDVSIGENAWIGPGSVIGRQVVIGERTRLFARVVVQDECVIGHDCLLHPGVVIGADGFGFARDGKRWVKQPQRGRVVIGNDVEIGANTAIDRGTFGDTTIGNGVKIDNLVQVAHNVCIGDYTAIAAGVGIAGSTVIGKCCTVAGQAGIIEHVKIADDVHITAGSLVTNSIPQAGVYSASIKAEPASEWRRNSARLHQLDEIARRLRQVEETLQRISKE
jgi:UDP-3-O-[3-hydroxymyristoyl] glucosamine N-acyltransferase